MRTTFGQQILFKVPTLTLTTLYVLVFIAHGRRELVHVNVTANPTAAWVLDQFIEATPLGNKPRHPGVGPQRIRPLLQPGQATSDTRTPDT